MHPAAGNPLRPRAPRRYQAKPAWDGADLVTVVSACVSRVGVVSHEDRYVALGCEDRQVRFDDVMLLVGDQLVQGSVYRLLAEHGDALFGDEYFADLFKRSTLGCPTVPARVVATVMLLQAYEGAQAHFCVGYLLQSSVSITVGQVRRKSRRRSRHRP